jgi:hypothetical protein
MDDESEDEGTAALSRSCDNFHGFEIKCHQFHKAMLVHILEYCLHSWITESKMGDDLKEIAIVRIYMVC